MKRPFSSALRPSGSTPRAANGLEAKRCPSGIVTGRLDGRLNEGHSLNAIGHIREVVSLSPRVNTIDLVDNRFGYPQVDIGKRLNKPFRVSERNTRRVLADLAVVNVTPPMNLSWLSAYLTISSFGCS